MNVTDETNRKLSEESYNNHAINDTIQTPTGNFKVIENVTTQEMDSELMYLRQL